LIIPAGERNRTAACASPAARGSRFAWSFYSRSGWIEKACCGPSIKSERALCRPSLTSPSASKPDWRWSRKCSMRPSRRSRSNERRNSNSFLIRRRRERSPDRPYLNDVDGRLRRTLVISGSQTPAPLRIAAAARGQRARTISRMLPAGISPRLCLSATILITAGLTPNVAMCGAMRV
jgi:hypothetical protein